MMHALMRYTPLIFLFYLLFSFSSVMAQEGVEEDFSIIPM
jgi:hypothetical protein|tara:strand:- start:10119 stop:10238 length:120 start_codon:yes stop_codon:yes gene_type:complete